jgi:hypothetical protein
MRYLSWGGPEGFRAVQTRLSGAENKRYGRKRIQTVGGNIDKKDSNPYDGFTFARRNRICKGV